MRSAHEIVDDLLLADRLDADAVSPTCAGATSPRSPGTSSAWRGSWRRTTSRSPRGRRRDTERRVRPGQHPTGTLEPPRQRDQVLAGRRQGRGVRRGARPPSPLSVRDEGLGIPPDETRDLREVLPARSPLSRGSGAPVSASTSRTSSSAVWAARSASSPLREAARFTVAPASLVRDPRGDGRLGLELDVLVQVPARLVRQGATHPASAGDTPARSC